MTTEDAAAANKTPTQTPTRPDPLEVERRAVQALEVFEASRAVGQRELMVEVDVAQTFDPESIVGRKVGVYWAGEEAWFMGVVGKFEGEKSMRHRVDYADGTVEQELLAAERVKMLLPLVPHACPAAATSKSMREYASTLVLEAVTKSNTSEAISLRRRADVLRDAQAVPKPFPPRYGSQWKFGDVVLGLNRGYPPWPALVVTWEQALNGAGDTGKFENMVPVLYFGTYQRQLLRSDHVLRFGKGFSSNKAISKAFQNPNRHLYWKSFEEALLWLSQGAIPDAMLPTQDDDGDDDGEEEGIDEESMKTNQNQNRNTNRNQRKSKGRGRPKRDESGTEKLSEAIVCKAVRQWQMRYARRTTNGGDGLPIKITDTRGATIEVLCLGRIEWLHPGYHIKECLWPVGYAAIRYTPHSALCLEIRETPHGSGPNFAIFGPEGLLVEARSPAEAWLVIDKKLTVSTADKNRILDSTLGAKEFGLCSAKVQKELVKLPGADRCEKFEGCEIVNNVHSHSHPHILTKEEMKQRLFYEAAWLSRLPSGHQGSCVRAIKWLSPGAGICAVCLEEEEDEEDLIVQCDGCGIFVHMLCYAVKHAPHGRLWLCDVCLIGASNCPPACALCPVIGGPLKRSECGRWVHPTCALWIDGPALEHDVRYGGVLDGLVAGLSSIHPSAFKATCTICNQRYGACVQCCQPACYTTFHIMCARQGGYRMQLVMDDEDRTTDHRPDREKAAHNGSQRDATENGHRKRKKKKRKVGRREGKSGFGMSINGARLIVYCAKHSKSGKESEIASTRLSKSVDNVSHPNNRYTTSEGKECLTNMESGLLPTWQEENQSPSSKLRIDLRVKMDSGSKIDTKQPIPLVISTGPVLPYTNTPRGNCRRVSNFIQKNDKGALLVKTQSKNYSEKNISTITERYEEMRLTLPRRVLPGKSGVHGWGAFAKERHVQGQMVIEYVGDLVRPSVADAREAALYNSMVGAGTYIFRLNADFCVDATRAGNLAHLLNHSCNPNCYSRTVPVWDAKLNRAVDHVIIFALRDIAAWEELTYDYRFSGEERLPCSCGAPTCRGVVNEIKPE